MNVMNDYSRILILAGLAVTAYLLVLAWDEDYGNRTRLPDLSDTAILPPPVADPLSEPSAAELPPAATGPIADEVPDDVPVAAADTRAVSAPPTDSTIAVATDQFNIDIDLRGGDLVRAWLPAFPASINTPDSPYVMLDPRNQYAAQSGLVGKDGPDSAGGRPLYQATATRFEMEGDELVVPLVYETPDGLRVEKRYRFRRGSYVVEVEFHVDNQRRTPASLNLFAQLKRDDAEPVSLDDSGMGMRPYLGAATNTGDRRYEKLRFDDVADEPHRHTSSGGYMAMIQHYFLSAWMPADDADYTYSARHLAERDIYLFGFTGPAVVVDAGEQATLRARLYVGPKDQYVLGELADGLDLTVDYGFLWWLAQPLFHALNLFHALAPNWGAAIVLLTLAIKILLFPLSAASFRSMAKMRKLQPEMERLRERFGDDRQKFSAAMMELYKKEGANPLGGCLPMLMQMPVFIALYWVLLESVELRQAPLDGYWIRDLSAMDPLFVLPILMGGSMYLTQLMQPEPPDPVQARMFKLMPVVFTFFFLWFPAGLVLYWLVNNILSVAQQMLVNYRLKVEEQRRGAQS